MEKEVESSTTLAGVTLEELGQTLLGNTNKKGRGGALSMALLEIYFLKMVGHPSWDREFSFFV